MIVRHADGLVGFEVPDDSPLARSIQLRDLREQAARQVEQYPQYAGNFDADQGWRLAVAKRDVKTKGGLRFARGEVFIAQIKTDAADEFRGRTFGWSARGAISCLLPDSAFRFLLEARA